MQAWWVHEDFGRCDIETGRKIFTHRIGAASRMSKIKDIISDEHIKKTPNTYLQNVILPEAVAGYIAQLAPFTVRYKVVAVADALGCVTAQAVYSATNSPLYDCAAMDGIAVISADTSQARDISPIRLKLDEDFVEIDTGDPVLPPYDAVIMIEDIERVDDTATIRKAATAYQHVRAIGEDIVKGEMILPRGHKIRAVDIGSLLSGGVVDVIVRAAPRVAIIPTGTELIEPGTEIRTGCIIESNSRMLAALLAENNCEPVRYSIVPDICNNLCQTVIDAVADSDMVLLCSGTSAGREDYTRQVMDELGEVITHGVAIKPGKPVILAKIGGKPVVGVPGYPVSAYIVYRTIIAEVISAICHEKINTPNTIQATLTKRLVSSVKHKEFVRVKLGKIAGKFVATPLPRGAGAGMSLVRADGFCIIEKETEGLEAGTTVQIELLRPREVLEKTLISIGSHDIVMDVLTDILGGKVNLSSSHVGTMGGLMALKNNECHIAPIHFLDEESGNYNIPMLQQLFRDRKVALIKGVQRIQGLMIAHGNPLMLHGIKCLPRCKYVNRGRGTGTRMFLDYHIKREGISSDNIIGYDREVATHMIVGGIVASGGADTGLGVMSAALACGLDFVPIGEEEYDFAVFADTLMEDNVQKFIAALKSEEFREKVGRLGGYGVENCGEVIML